MPRISPTVGRMVYYYPSTLEQEIAAVPFVPFVMRGAGPLSANIAHVFSDTMVNLCVIDSNGVGHARQSVPFIPADSPAPQDGSAYATWMPFQLSQAAKAEQAQQDPAGATSTVESLKYSDGTVATGTASLPGQSPAQQDVNEAAPAAPSPTDPA